MANITNGIKNPLQHTNAIKASHNIEGFRKLEDASTAPNVWVARPMESTTDDFLSRVRFTPHKDCSVDNKELNDFLLGIDLD
jgi:hypothetical protein